MQGLVKQLKNLFVPKLRGSKDLDYVTDSTEQCLLDMRSRIFSLESQTTEGVVAPVVAKAADGERGLAPCRLVHVRQDGTAVLAVNSAADRYCTHVVASLGAGGSLVCYGIGHFAVCCKVEQNTGDQVPLWLSDLPGFATDVEPTSAVVKQRVGERMSLMDGGVVYAVFKPEFWPGQKGPKGDTGDQGPQGEKGDKGDKGDTGDAGQGVPTGGTTGQHLVKSSGTDYDTEWDDPWSLTVADADAAFTNTTQIEFIGADVDYGAGSGEVVVTIPSIETTDGTTTVDPVTKLTFSGATVTDSGSGEATITIIGGGVDPVVGTAGESGIVAGMLVHVGSDGVVWKADATSMIRYMTHAVDSVSGSDITCVNVGTVDVLTDDESPYDHTNTYYLSAISKGYATPKPPATPSGSSAFAVRQMIGTGQGARDSGTGKTSITLQLEQGVYI